MSDPSPRIVHLHIPKAAGYTWRGLLDDVFTGEVTGAEWCFEQLYDGGKGITHTALFRSPRSHVLSQYMMCAYSDWGQSGANHVRTPGASDETAIASGFGRWIKHFGSAWHPRDSMAHNQPPRQRRCPTKLEEASRAVEKNQICACKAQGVKYAAICSTYTLV